MLKTKAPNTISEVKAAIDAFESQFRVELTEFPPRMFNRNVLYRAKCAEAGARACLPENVARRLKLHAQLARARRSARAKAAAARPDNQLRKLIFRRLRRLGFSREYVSGRSAYYARGVLQLRVSDHEVPQTAERDYNRANGGFSWSDTWRSHVVDPDDLRASAKWLREVREAVQS